jgi:tRNA nucleotidyltransferase (CCA-adding enzyme)
MDFLPRVLSEIKPSEEEFMEETEFSKLLVAHVQENSPPGSKVVLTGSVAKGTFLREKRDIDIFVLFNRSVPRSELEPAMKRIMDMAFPTLPYQLSYAEHPYVRFYFEGRRIDLVPAYRISDASERLSAVDRSVLHTDFILGALGRKQVGEVLLLKQFLRANGLYGAEIKIEGLSGYLCELLIVKFKSFEGLIRAASKWKEPVFIDIKGYYPPKEIPAARKAFSCPFIVIDPTDKGRNVAAAVSRENFGRLVALAREFVSAPSEEAFFRTPPSFEENAAMAWGDGELFILSMPRPEVVDDVLWGQLRKLCSQLKAALKDFGCSDVIADDTRLLVRLAIVVRARELPAKVEVQGPPLEMKRHVAEFRKAHKGAKFSSRGGRLLAAEKRAVTKAEDAVMAFFHGYASARSHLSFHEEMLILEYIHHPRRRKKRKAADN